MSRLGAIPASLERSLSPDIAVAAADPSAPPPPMMKNEAAAVERAIADRRREFAWGRAVARAALRDLDVNASALLIRPDRRPAWPEDVTGSISHCSDLCGALVARRSAARAIGLDLEPRGPLEPELWETIITGVEHEHLIRGSTASSPGEAAKLGFVIKEAYYKAQFELTQTLLGFDDVRLTWISDGQFRAECAATRLEPVVGRFALTERHLWAWVIHPTSASE